MTPRALMGFTMSFTSATPDLLVRFRHKLCASSAAASQQRQHIFWVSEFIEHFAGRTLSSITYDEIQRFTTRVEAKHSLDQNGRDEVLSSVRMLYQEIDGIEPPWARACATATKRQEHHPFAALSRTTLRTVLPLVEYHSQLPVALVYGSGLKTSECARIRVGDIDLAQSVIQVRGTDGRITHRSVLPRALRAALTQHLEQRRQTHLKDTTQNFAGAPVPPALAQQDEPYARSWRCQFLFADGQLTPLGDGRMIRREINPRRFEKAIRMAADRVELGENVTAKSLRLSFARHLIQAAVDPVILQYVLGQLPELPAAYQPVFQNLRSPLDQLWPDGRSPWRD